MYARNGPAVLAVRSDRLGDDLYAGDCRPYLMDERDSLDVDEPSDLELAELLLAAAVAFRRAPRAGTPRNRRGRGGRGVADAGHGRQPEFALRARESALARDAEHRRDARRNRRPAVARRRDARRPAVHGQVSGLAMAATPAYLVVEAAGARHDRGPEPRPLVPQSLHIRARDARVAPARPRRARIGSSPGSAPRPRSSSAWARSRSRSRRSSSRTRSRRRSSSRASPCWSPRSDERPGSQRRAARRSLGRRRALGLDRGRCRRALRDRAGAQRAFGRDPSLPGGPRRSAAAVRVQRLGLRQPAAHALHRLLARELPISTRRRSRRWSGLSPELFSSLGLLTLAPTLALGIAGSVLLFRRGRRAEALVCIGVPFALPRLLRRERAFGGLGPPRYLTPIMPFALLPLALALRRWPLATLTAAAITCSRRS